MTQPTFYVSPEQQIKDRAEFARLGIAKGRCVVVARYAGGILLVGENRSQSLHKISEIYDRLGFAAVGKYNEFENLRVAGIRHADIRGYAYDRRDVTGRTLAGAYAQLLGTIFSSVMEKPYEVELVVAEVGLDTNLDQIFRVSFDGSITEETQFAVIGGAADLVDKTLREGYSPTLSLSDCLKLTLKALSADSRGAGKLDGLEVALLERDRTQARKFRRLSTKDISSLTKIVKPRTPKTPQIKDNQ
ncbi:MAG: proteasome subunit alpha [Propionibacteriaceae bacterium]|nr:proteasome subunit alpha [Propionibacteriaceae bacterium]